MSIFTIKDTIGEEWTNVEKQFINSPLSCNKLGNLTERMNEQTKNICM